MNEVGAEKINITFAAPVVLQEFLQQPMRERDEDWFVLLDVVPRTSLVPGGIALLHSFFFKAGRFFFWLV